MTHQSVPRIALGRRWLENLLAHFGAPSDPAHGDGLAVLYREFYARLSRARRRALKRRLEHDLEREIRTQRELRLSRGQRRRLVGATVALLLGVAAPHAGRATVQIVDDVDFVITVLGVEDVAVDCSPGGKVRVADGSGQSIEASTNCADVNVLSVLGQQDDDSKTIDLRGMMVPHFSSASVVTVTTGGGADTVYGPEYGNTIDLGGGDDVLELGAAMATVTAGDGDDVITLGPGIDGATVYLGGGDDSVMATVTSQAVYGAMIDASGAAGEIDQLTVFGDAFANTICVSDVDVHQSNGNTIGFSELEGLTVLGGDEAGPVGDTLTVLHTGGIDVLVDGGAPNVAPGDTLYLTDPNTPHQGFETVIQISGLPATSGGGLLAIGAGLLAGAWRGLRGWRGRRDDASD